MDKNTQSEDKDIESLNKTIIVSKNDKNKNNDTKSQKLDKQIPNNKTMSNKLDNRVFNERYKIEQLVGHGGMCDVYKAKDLFLEERGDPTPYVAIKVLQNDINEQPDAVNILIREAKKTQGLSHPNIIRVYDFGIDRNECYLVMEWLDGQTLDEVIKSHRPRGLSFKNSMALLKQLMAALKYAHKNNVIHADLKPANIMLTRDGNIKIFDFGVSQGLDPSFYDQYSASYSQESMSVSGYTPTYASPDRLKNLKPTFADDVFSFSCIAYELLSSKHPFQRKTAAQAIKENIQPTKPQNIPFPYWSSLKKGLAFDANIRFPSIEQLESRLSINIWKPVTLIASIAIVISIASTLYIQQAKQLTLTQEHVNSLVTNEKRVQRLLETKPQELLKILDTIPEDQEVQKLALLKKHQREIVTFYEKQISDLLNQKDRSYPDYYAVQSLLNKAMAIYPDSYSLTLTSENINQAWMSTVHALIQRINTLLEHGQYNIDTNGDDIYTLYNDLKLVKKDYTFTPNTKSKEMFVKTFKQANNKLDIDSLTAHLHAAKTLFNEQDLPKELINKGIELKNAISTMAKYEQESVNNPELEFPEQAARQLYQSRFDALNERVKNANKTTTLSEINQDLDTLASKLPDNFPFVITTRQLIINRYLYFSDYLIKRNKTAKAQAIMKEAQKLMTLMQGKNT